MRATIILSLCCAAILGGAAEDWRQQLTNRLGLQLNGFVDTRAGTRLADDSFNDDLSLADLRLQLELLHDQGLAIWQLRFDLLGDGVESDSLDLETGRGWLDLREANVSLPLGDNLELKAGRQILTWGTGTMLFINDMFPKDWESFFIGRDSEYLKAPSDALMASWFGPAATLDLVLTPRFDADRYIRGERLSYFSSTLGSRSAASVETIKQDQWFDDAETAVRLHGDVNGYEVALYGYHGFWKSPAGLDPSSGLATHPLLSVYGASARGALGSGIINAELGYYDSRSDRNGDDPFVANDELRVLIGYQKEIASETTLGLQWYLEWLQDYDAYQDALPAGSPARDEHRHVFTVDLTRLMLNQDLRLNLFAYYSPTDEDTYLRPQALYKISDQWHVTLGANLFFGDAPHTFFGQFEKNSNVYASVRRYF